MTIKHADNTPMTDPRLSAVMAVIEGWAGLGPRPSRAWQSRFWLLPMRPHLMPRDAACWRTVLTC